jgi:hypothetical protein
MASAPEADIPGAPPSHATRAQNLGSMKNIRSHLWQYDRTPGLMNTRGDTRTRGVQQMVGAIYAMLTMEEEAR